MNLDTWFIRTGNFEMDEMHTLQHLISLLAMIPNWMFDIGWPGHLINQLINGLADLLAPAPWWWITRVIMYICSHIISKSCQF